MKCLKCGELDLERVSRVFGNTAPRYLCPTCGELYTPLVVEPATELAEGDLSTQR